VKSSAGSLDCALGDGLRARLHPGVGAQALQRAAAPRLRVARIEQDLDALEHLLRQVEIGNQQPMLEIARVPHPAHRIGQDVEVLQDLAVRLRLFPVSQPAQDPACGRVEALERRGLEIQHRALEALDAEGGHVLGLECAERLEYHRRVAVAALEPKGRGGARRQRQA
jgi:hypothetical protein